MKTLYLIRHAKSSWDNPNLSDFDRELNDRGKKDALEMGKRLYEKGAIPDYILSSSSVRTKKTAKRITQGILFPYANVAFTKNLYKA